MKTVGQTIVRQMTTWAVPKPEWRLLEEDYDGVPFEYQVLPYGYDAYPSTSVRVCTTNVHIDIPEGIDLVAAAVDTIEKKMEQLQAQADHEIAKCREQINRLQLLEHTP